ncbi:gamma-glutamylcyclotransferase family protein [Streptomyces sp. NPDC087420]|uniref:gamma-glutamylcyclotransferase family protein n=1 Tax=Streptomyces sp. NPDC087420 TaxID=3365785 RepID=UPI003833D7D9
MPRPDHHLGEELPFFVYGTLRPGEDNYELFLRGRTTGEEPSRLENAALYDGPGYPYAIETPGATIVGEIVSALPGAGRPGAGPPGTEAAAGPGTYGELLSVLDELEEYVAPGDPRNLYERVPRDVRRADGTTVRAWVYFAAPRVARELRAAGRPIAGGD